LFDLDRAHNLPNNNNNNQGNPTKLYSLVTCLIPHLLMKKIQNNWIYCLVDHFSIFIPDIPCPLSCHNTHHDLSNLISHNLVKSNWPFRQWAQICLSHGSSRSFSFISLWSMVDHQPKTKWKFNSEIWYQYDALVSYRRFDWYVFVLPTLIQI